MDQAVPHSQMRVASRYVLCALAILAGILVLRWLLAWEFAQARILGFAVSVALMLLGLRLLARWPTPRAAVRQTVWIVLVAGIAVMAGLSPLAHERLRMLSDVPVVQGAVEQKEGANGFLCMYACYAGKELHYPTNASQVFDA